MGLMGKAISPYYRLAVLVRKDDYPDSIQMGARLEDEKIQ